MCQTCKQKLPNDANGTSGEKKQKSMNNTDDAGQTKKLKLFNDSDDEEDKANEAKKRKLVMDTAGVWCSVGKWFK